MMEKLILLAEIGTPYLVVLLGAFLSGAIYLFKTTAEIKQEQAVMRTVMEYYVKRQADDALRKLDTANPTPPDIRLLVQRQMRGERLSLPEYEQLVNWLRLTSRGENPDADSTEVSAALQILTTLRTVEELNKPRKKWWKISWA